MAKEFVKFSVPKEVADKTFEVIEKVRTGGGSVRIGTNEATKSIEGNVAKLIVIAEDVEPAEIVMHLPLLCKEKKIAYTFVPTKKELGAAAGIEVSTSAVAITKDGKAKKELSDLITKVLELGK
ncbi:MAG: 50S ribosomal protein L7ae [Candidatus Diapherotrites archaeon]|nr:50S ribosomal protein L7ae [Candidatus Diapherotrites archaeon]